MRVLWIGDADVSTGFAHCTHNVCDELVYRGHEVEVLGINYFGLPHDHKYKIYPCFNPNEGCRDNMGQDSLPYMLHKAQKANTPFDIVVLLNDPWNIDGYFKAVHNYNTQLQQRRCEQVTLPPVVSWMAVDSHNHDIAPLRQLSHIIVWTDWARDELIRCGGNSDYISVVGLGVDTGVYKPHDREMSRKTTFPAHLELPNDAFIVGVVGRNQPRKRLDLTIQYFASWVQQHQHDNCYLYLHVAPTGEAGCDLRRVARYYNISHRVIVGEPPIGKGIDEQYMPQLYSSFNCYLTTSQAEGWGLPALEAMACGIPCILPDHSAYSSWAKDCAVLVPCYDHCVLTAPLNGGPYTIGQVPRLDATVAALQQCYETGLIDESHNGYALARSIERSWGWISVQVCDRLEHVAGSVKESEVGV